jgi:hypothetical protein
MFRDIQKQICIGKSFEKTIEDAIDKPYYDRMHQRMQTKKAKIMKKVRQSTVEPVLGTLINFLNMKRINIRGIRQANKQVLMAALAYNLKKYMAYSKRTRNVLEMDVIQTFEYELIMIINSFIMKLYRFLIISTRFSFT